MFFPSPLSQHRLHIRSLRHSHAPVVVVLWLACALTCLPPAYSQPLIQQAAFGDASSGSCQFPTGAAVLSRPLPLDDILLVTCKSQQNGIAAFAMTLPLAGSSDVPSTDALILPIVHDAVGCASAETVSFHPQTMAAYIQCSFGPLIVVNVSRLSDEHPTFAVITDVTNRSTAGSLHQCAPESGSYHRSNGWTRFLRLCRCCFIGG